MAACPKADRGKIEDELRQFLEYGVPMMQARMDIARYHGGMVPLTPEDKLEKAIKICREFGEQSDFLGNVLQFYTNRGYMTEKQVEAVLRVNLGRLVGLAESS